MAMSSLTYILGFSVRFFSASLVYSVQKYYEIKITSKSFAQKFEFKRSLGGPLSKLCVTPPFSINFRCQIENQVSDYRLLGASSLTSVVPKWKKFQNCIFFIFFVYGLLIRYLKYQLPVLSIEINVREKGRSRIENPEKQSKNKKQQQQQKPHNTES